MDNQNFKLQIKEKAIVLIDWANIRNQQKKLGWDIDLEKLFNWLKSHEDIEKIQFFYGYKNTEESRKFLEKVKSFGYEIITKEVKYMQSSMFNSVFKKNIGKIIDLLLNETFDGRLSKGTLTDKDFKSLGNKMGFIEKQAILKIPKCDLDAEIVTEIMKNFEDIQTVILFSGDGDFAYTIKECLKDWKKVYIISGFKRGGYSSIGREIWNFKKENPKKYPAILNLEKFTFLKKIPVSRN